LNVTEKLVDGSLFFTSIIKSILKYPPDGR